MYDDQDLSRWDDDGGACAPADTIRHHEWNEAEPTCARELMRLRKAGQLMLETEGAYHNDVRCLS